VKDLDDEQKERLFEFVSAMERTMVSYGFALTFREGKLMDMVKGTVLPCYLHSHKSFDETIPASSFALGDS